MLHRRFESDHFKSKEYSLHQDRSLTLMVLSSGNSVLRWSISRVWFTVCLFVLVSLVMVISYGVWFSFYRVTDYNELHQLRQTVTEQKQALDSFEDKLSVLVESVEDLVLSEAQLRQKLKLRPAKKKSSRRATHYQRQAQIFRRDLESIFQEPVATISEYSKGLEYLQSHIFTIGRQC